MSDATGPESADSLPRPWNLMIKIMMTYEQGLGPIPIGSPRGIIERQDALDAVAQLSAVVDESYNAGLISKGKASFLHAFANGPSGVYIALSERRAQ